MTGENITLTQMSQPNEVVEISLIPIFTLSSNYLTILKDFLESFDDDTWLDVAQKNIETSI